MLAAGHVVVIASTWRWRSSMIAPVFAFMVGAATVGAWPVLTAPLATDGSGADDDTMAGVLATTGGAPWDPGRAAGRLLHERRGAVLHDGRQWPWRGPLRRGHSRGQAAAARRLCDERSAGARCTARCRRTALGHHSACLCPGRTASPQQSARTLRSPQRMPARVANTIAKLARNIAMRTTAAALTILAPASLRRLLAPGPNMCVGNIPTEGSAIPAFT